jgi:hypothetical protein
MTEKLGKVSSVNKKTKNNNSRHPLHEADLTWAQRAKLAQKGSLMTEIGSFKLSKVRNKNTAIFAWNWLSIYPSSTSVPSCISNTKKVFSVCTS